MQELCDICLKTNETLRNVEENVADGTKILQKLLICVPEVEWNNLSLKICDNCIKDLEIVHNFKELCIQSFVLRTKVEDKTDVLSDNDDYNDNYESFDVEVTENKINAFVCEHCTASFDVKVDLEKHLKKVHCNRRQGQRKKQFSCGNCGKLYTTENGLKKHSSACGGDGKKELNKVETDDCKEEIILTPTCEICGTTFSNKYLLKRHRKNVHVKEKKFACDSCDRTFASSVYLNAHKRYHKGDRTHICSFCGKGFITASDLYHHEKIHANKRAYRCEICPKAFNTSSDLHKHKICVHQDRSKWKYQCTFCQRRFPLKTNLDTHTKTHTGEKNFACHLCERKCINRSVLLRHIETHSNMVTFKCEYCTQGYKYQKSLDIHMAKVHGVGTAKIPERIKKHFCHICPKSYFANNKLQKHIRSHTGERPFKCPNCDKCFIDKSYVKQHLKSAHSIGDV